MNPPMEGRGLTVGIGAYQAAPRLYGCVPDAHHLALSLGPLLAHRPRMLADNRADRANILNRIKPLGEGSRWALWLSGHGSHVRDTDADEDDGRDEVFCPFDPAPSTWWDDGLIWDDEWIGLLPKNRPGLFGIDCCHAGTQMRDMQGDNPHMIRNRSIVPPPDVAMREVDTGVSPGRVVDQLGESGAPIVYLGASQDSQVSADYWEPDCMVCLANPRILTENGYQLGYHGALSMAFLTVLWTRLDAVYEGGEIRYRNLKPFSFAALEDGIHAWFRERPHFSQVPSLRLFGGLVESDPLPIFEAV